MDRGRPHPAALRRIHPVREVEDVEFSEEAFGGGVAKTAPRRPDRVGEGEGPRPQLDVDTRERLADPARAADARGREGDDLVPPRRRLGETAERALDVVPDPEQRMAQRADVERDPHLRKAYRGNG